MYQIDMEKFGNFLCTLRKGKNLTQKELGDKLFVSDKTVSKWERGISIPNVSLLIPIAEILDVTVTELLKGEHIQNETLELAEIEHLVTCSVDMSIQEHNQTQRSRQKWSLIYFGCLSAAVLEIGLMAFFGYNYILEGSLLYLSVGLSFILAMWLCLFAKESLPSYYDENDINFVSMGIFRMNLPGVHFNNKNWGPILNTLRIYLLVLGVGYPALHLILFGILKLDPYSMITAYMTFPLFFGVFTLIYIIAGKYNRKENEMKTQKKTKFVIITLVFAAVLIFAANAFGLTSNRSSFKIGYIGNETARTWSGRYYYLDGFMQHTMRPKTEPDTLYIDVETKKGSISIQIEDADGNILFSENNIGNESFKVEISEKAVVQIEAEKHKGSFVIECE